MAITFDTTKSNPYTTFSNGNLTLTQQNVNVGAVGWTFATAAGTGKWYAEFVVNNPGSGGFENGWGIGTPASGNYGGSLTAGAVYRGGFVWLNGTNQNATAFPDPIAGDIVQVAVDVTNSKIWFGKNNVWYNSGNPSTGANGYTYTSTGMAPTAGLMIKPDAVARQMTGRFTAASQTYAPPTGFTAVDSSGAAAQTLTPTLYTNAQTFYAPKVNMTLLPALFTNTQAFFAPKVNLNVLPSLLTNAQTFYSPKVNFTLNPALFTNTQTFYSPSVNIGPAPQNITPSLFVNAQIFYGPTVIQAQFVRPPLFTNAQLFYSPRVTLSIYPTLFTNVQTFYSPVVTIKPPTIVLNAPLITNVQTFYGASVQIVDAGPPRVKAVNDLTRWLTESIPQVYNGTRLS